MIWNIPSTKLKVFLRPIIWNILHTMSYTYFTMYLLYDLVESLPFPFEVEDRKRIYQYLTHKISAQDVRYFAHFLIPYDDVDKIYADNVENIEGVITAVLDSWDCMSPSWNKLKSVLKFLGRDELVNNIKGRGFSSLYYLILFNRFLLHDFCVTVINFFMTIFSIFCRWCTWQW